MTSASLEEGKTPRTPRDVRPQKLHLGDMSVVSPKRQCLSRPSDQSQSAHVLSIVAPSVAYQEDGERRGPTAPHSLLFRSFSSDLCGYSSETSRESPFSTIQFLSTLDSDSFESNSTSSNFSSSSRSRGSSVSTTAGSSVHHGSSSGGSFSPPVSNPRRASSITPPPVLLMPTNSTHQSVESTRIPRQPPLQQAILEEEEVDSGGRASSVTTILSANMMKTWRIASPSTSNHMLRNRMTPSPHHQQQETIEAPLGHTIQQQLLKKRSLFGPPRTSSATNDHREIVQSISTVLHLEKTYDKCGKDITKKDRYNIDEDASWRAGVGGLFGGEQSPFTAGTQSPISPPELFNVFSTSTSTSATAAVPNRHCHKKKIKHQFPSSLVAASQLNNDVQRSTDAPRSNSRAISRSYSEPAAASTPVSCTSTSDDANIPAAWFFTNDKKKQQVAPNSNSLFTPPVTRRILYSWGLRARCSSWDGSCGDVNDWGISTAASDDDLALFRQKLLLRKKSKSMDNTGEESSCWISVDRQKITTSLPNELDSDGNEIDESVCDQGIYVSPTSAFGHMARTQSCETNVTHDDHCCDSI